MEKATAMPDVPVEEKTFEFRGGIYGFPETERYLIVEVPGGGDIFKQMVAVDQPDLRFTLVFPYAFFPDYAPDVPEEEMQEVGAAGPEQVLLMAIASVPADVREATANLRAPLLFNPYTRKGRQVILPDDRHPTRAHLLKR